MNYQQHFSTNAPEYLRFRPDYPDSLYQFLATLTTEKSCVLDCATGNGQAAVRLAKDFQQVIATDINFTQLEVAPHYPSIQYVCCAAECLPLRSKSVDLITVAQALHWFDFDVFYHEVRRVARPDACIAAWCYSLGKINRVIDSIILYLYDTILGDKYWPAPRRFIDEAYISIPFPFEKKLMPTFTMEKSMDFNQLIGYLGTWSAMKAYQTQTRCDPLTEIMDDLRRAWGKPERIYTIHWPLHLLVGRIN